MKIRLQVYCAQCKAWIEFTKWLHTCEVKHPLVNGPRSTNDLLRAEKGH